MVFGNQFGCYLKADRAEIIDSLVGNNPKIYSSRNQFIRAAVESRIRLENFLLTFDEPARSELRSKFLRMEQDNGGRESIEVADEKDNPVSPKKGRHGTTKSDSVKPETGNRIFG